ncbi:MAG: type II toxin-antitoxin system RelE/ParE family toxin [Geopsychrobacter sp.]|nr:type II toxin-antitoxin system RelE/ParE family toxin [Geopsychrobacter sp.]
MKRPVLVLSAQAREDLTEIWLYIATDSTVAADSFVDLLFRQCLSICDAPYMGRNRDNLLPGVRSFAYKRYIIFYRHLTEKVEIEIVRILSAYRDVEALF